MLLIVPLCPEVYTWTDAYPKLSGSLVRRLIASDQADFFFRSRDGGCAAVYALGGLPRRRALSSCAHGYQLTAVF